MIKAVRHSFIITSNYLGLYLAFTQVQMKRRTTFLIFILLLTGYSLPSSAISTKFISIKDANRLGTISETDPLIKAIDSDHVEVLWSWLKKNNSPNTVIKNRMKERLFDRAASHGSVRSCTLLLKVFRHFKMRSKLVDSRGTPILVALASLALPESPKEKKYYKIIQNILKIFPESIHDQDKAYVGDGRTALHEAAANGNVNLMKLLISKGAQINAVSSIGETPLHFAARFGHLGAVKHLLMYRANPNAQSTHQKSTPLMLAAEKGDANTMNLLLAYDARRDLKDTFGKTATDRYREHLDQLVASGQKKSFRQ